MIIGPFLKPAVAKFCEMEVCGENSESPATAADKSTLRRSGGLGGHCQTSAPLAALTGSADYGSIDHLSSPSRPSAKGEAGDVAQAPTRPQGAATRQDDASTDSNLTNGFDPAVPEAESAAATYDGPGGPITVSELPIATLLRGHADMMFKGCPVRPQASRLPRIMEEPTYEFIIGVKDVVASLNEAGLLGATPIEMARGLLAAAGLGCGLLEDHDAVAVGKRVLARAMRADTLIAAAVKQATRAPAGERVKFKADAIACVHSQLAKDLEIPTRKRKRSLPPALSVAPSGAAPLPPPPQVCAEDSESDDYQCGYASDTNEYSCTDKCKSRFSKARAEWECADRLLECAETDFAKAGARSYKFEEICRRAADKANRDFPTGNSKPKLMEAHRHS